MASLSDEFRRQMQARAERGAPSSVRGAMDRYGWTTRDVAQRFGVSDRTARRWRQQNRIPERRRADWRRETTSAAERRVRERMERRGLAGMSVTGTYMVSKSRYKAGPGYPVRFGTRDNGNPVAGTNRITAAQMRGYFAAIDQGDQQAADDLLNDALAQAYGADGLHFEDVDEVHFDI